MHREPRLPVPPKSNTRIVLMTVERETVKFFKWDFDHLCIWNIQSRYINVHIVGRQRLETYEVERESNERRILVANWR